MIYLETAGLFEIVDCMGKWHNEQTTLFISLNPARIS